MTLTDSSGLWDSALLQIVQINLTFTKGEIVLTFYVTNVTMLQTVKMLFYKLLKCYKSVTNRVTMGGPWSR